LPSISMSRSQDPEPGAAAQSPANLNGLTG
jgi:hypothetical protein